MKNLFLPIVVFACFVLAGILTSSTMQNLAMHIPVIGNGVSVPLSGVSILEKKPHFGFASWFSGDYQAKSGRWAGQNFGFRGLLIQTDNQIGYSVFHKSNTPSSGIIVGRDKILHEEDYVLEYCGLIPQPSDTQLECLAADLEEVGNRFRARGVGFLVYISPTKAAVYPETLPPAYLARKTNAPRAYERMLPLLQKHHVPYADGHHALMEAKAAYPIPQNPPLFSRGGIHYNDWGMVFAMQVLRQALEKEGGTPLPALRYQYPVPTDYQPVGTDDDFARLINVLFLPNHYVSPHPDLRFDPAHPQNAGISVIGGSFCWHPLQLLDENHVYDSMDFYYYYHTALHHYPGDTEEIVNPDLLDWNQTFLRSRVVVLEISEAKFALTEATHFSAFLRDAKRHLPPVEKEAQAF